MGPSRSTLPSGRQHFQHGPIDLVIAAEGDADAVQAAHDAAWLRFAKVLAELVAELPLLRAPVGAGCPVQGPVACRMWQACAPYRSGFITPMAAVAGAVAQEILAHYTGAGIARAWVNNGGDIAIHLTAGQQVRVGLWADLARFRPGASAHKLTTDAQFAITADRPVRGVATSGWRGRSFSMGIADSVTVLARDAAAADAAATVIANAVDVQDPRIARRPADQVKDDSDLGNRLVTVDVPPLPAMLVDRALQAGLARAQALRAQGLIWHAALVCQDRWRSTGEALDLQLVQ
ncbi:UPF0280 family protein [Pseudorhodoferax sp. Leaf274]|uniref:UPF0280 family protein n=1 Tax=Pseudorhodoferax sp. Leaf274 TaxID=1736318 RepID=UPI0007032283|nr:UPF0280 family protein [Pseudorhodoferax sp. Leaf274]KQP40014.1 thiamine biosynthesis protein ApbE [Pseudorhodoferax sp. Leaf274]